MLRVCGQIPHPEFSISSPDAFEQIVSVGSRQKLAQLKFKIPSRHVLKHKNILLGITVCV